MPCMIFSALYSADMSLLPTLGILPFVILTASIGSGVISYIVLKRLHYDDKKIWSVLVTVMIANTAFMISCQFRCLWPSRIFKSYIL